jgi:hypothetical protein
MLKSEAILDFFTGIIDQLVENNTLAFKGFGDSLPADVYPAAYVSVGRETSDMVTMSSYKHTLEIPIRISVESDKSRLDKDLYAIRLAIHTLIMEERNLGISFVQSAHFSGQSPNQYLGDGDSYRAATEITYLITFQSKVNEPEA